MRNPRIEECGEGQTMRTRTNRRGKKKEGRIPVVLGKKKTPPPKHRPKRKKRKKAEQQGARKKDKAELIRNTLALG